MMSSTSSRCVATTLVVLLCSFLSLSPATASAVTDAVERTGGNRGVGEKCQNDPYWRCASNLICENGTCKAPRGERCTKSDDCSQGLHCVGNEGEKKCMKPMRVGMACGNDPFWFCAEGLVCDRVCKIPKGNNCDGYENSCAAGLQCSGNNGTKKCVMPMGPGKKCQLDPYWTCANGLVCENGTCKIPKGQNCEGNENNCATGLQCAGNNGTKKCVMPMGPGKKCQLDPYWTCANGLVCENGTCKIPKGQNCEGNENNCATGLQCAGNNGTKKCVMPMGPGKKCQLDPYWTCANGLVCENGTCKIPKGQNCEGNENNCATGLQCAGNNGTKKCVMPMGPGKKCQLDPYWTCANGLVCENGTCKIPKGQNCEGNEYNCATGLQCAGNNGTKKCVMPMGPGKKCQLDPYWTCANGLVCENGTCKIPKGQNCEGNENNCATGLQCAGNNGTKKCVMPMGPGKKCQLDPYWTCANGLVCENGTCKIPKGQNCEGNEYNCATGLQCAGTTGNKKCVMPMGPGMKCQLDPFWTCATGLVCQNGTCRMPKGRNCNGYENSCATGLECAGSNGTKKCVMPMGPGMKCQGDPYWTCASGLICEGVCRTPMGGDCSNSAVVCQTGTSCVGRDYERTCERTA